MSEVAKVKAQRSDMEMKMEALWQSDERNSRWVFKQAVNKLHEYDTSDWYKLKLNSTKDPYIKSLLYGICMLMHHQADNESVLGTNEDNAQYGDKEALVHVYDCKFMYIMPLFCPYSFTDTPEKSDALRSVAHTVHNPRLRENNPKLNKYSPVANTLVSVSWLRHAWHYCMHGLKVTPLKLELDDILQDEAIVNFEMEGHRREMEERRVEAKNRFDKWQVCEDKQNELDKEVERLQSLLDRRIMRLVEEVNISKLEKIKDTIFMKGERSDQLYEEDFFWLRDDESVASTIHNIA